MKVNSSVFAHKFSFIVFLFNLCSLARDLVGYKFILVYRSLNQREFSCTMELDLVVSVASSVGVNLVVFFCSRISVALYDTLGIPKVTTLFLSSSHL